MRGEDPKMDRTEHENISSKSSAVNREFVSFLENRENISVQQQSFILQDQEESKGVSSRDKILPVLSINPLI